MKATAQTFNVRPDMDVAFADTATCENKRLLVARCLHRAGKMRSLVIVVALLAGCTESDADQLADLKDQIQQSCWSYFACENGGQSACAQPSTPAADGAACMNDALANDVTAMAAWGRDIFNPWETRETYVFAIDHGLRVFLSIAPGVDPAEVTEIHGCTGPLTATTNGTEKITLSSCTDY